MEKSGFFNAMKTGDTWDRVYKAENFAEYFASFIGNGVFPNPSSQLQVIQTDKMQVILKSGKAWINGFIYENTDDLILDIPVADGVLNRIDKVVLKYDVAKREIRACVKKGDFNSSPTSPSLDRTADMYELALADIKVNAGAIKISQADITDLRLNKSMCGIVHGTVDQVDTTAIFNQFESWYSTTKDNYDKDIINWTKEKKEAFEEWYSKNTQEFNQEFEEWFRTIKNKLDGDIAGNLLNSIKENAKKIEQVTTQYEDFEKQKGAKNGVAELDENGKVKKEQLPKLNYGTILGSDGFYYRPFMEDGKIISIDKHIIEGCAGFHPKLFAEDFVYGSIDGGLAKINRKNYKMDCSYRPGNNYDNDFFAADSKYLYVQGGYEIKKINMTNLSIVAVTKTEKFQTNSHFLACDDKYLYTTSRYGKKGYKIDKNTLELVAEYQLNYSITSSNFAFIKNNYIYVEFDGYILAIINKNDFSVVAKKEMESSIRAFESYDNYIYLVNEYNLSILNENTLETIKSIDISNYSKAIACLFSSKNYVAIANGKSIWVFDKNLNLLHKSEKPHNIDTSKNYFFDENEKLIYIGRIEFEKYELVYEIKYFKRIGDNK